MGPYCKFCGTRCFSHFPQSTPEYVLRAYGSSTIVATCIAGQMFEKTKVGYCYSDIKKIIDAQNRATVTFAPSLTPPDLDYWSQRAQEISNDFCAGLPVTFAPKTQ